MSRVMTLHDVAQGLGAEVVAVHGDSAVALKDVNHDSRSISPGDLFVALAGARTNGLEFVQDALLRGAAAIMVQAGTEVGTSPVPHIVVRDARRALARVAHFVHGDPTCALRVIGITGTNGKTTTTHLVESILRSVGSNPAAMGTVSMRGPGFEETATHTTPESDDVARFADRVLSLGATHLVMEVSSHALELHRVEAVHFEVAAFTNLTQDHLDFHGTMAAYGAAKDRLFLEHQPRKMVLNIDDRHVAELSDKLNHRAKDRVRHSTRADSEAEVVAIAWHSTREGIRANVRVFGADITLESPLIGAHNVENLLTALGCAVACEIPAQKAAHALAAAQGAPGRLERVAHPTDIGVFVDYAHTPDALARALEALRPITPGRLLTVFGCGGDRDRGKRPLMGQAAADRADLLFLTSDNPRTESPHTILDEIVPGVLRSGKSSLPIKGLAKARAGYVVVENREDAIGLAVDAACPGDTILIAGKGHEPYQIIGTEKRPFDDREVARRAIASSRERGVY